MGERILHCGTSLENYYTCINQQVAGFTKRVANVNDRVYIVVKVENKSLCGARGNLPIFGLGKTAINIRNAFHFAKSNTANRLTSAFWSKPVESIGASNMCNPQKP